MTAGRLWFVEVVVWILVALAVVCWLPLVRPAGTTMAVRRWRSRSWRSGLALRYDVFGFGLGPRRVVHRAGVLVLRHRLGGGEGDDGLAARRRSRSCWPSACSATSATRTGKCWCSPVSALLIWLPAIRCPAAFTVVAGHRRRGVAVHLSDPLPGVSAVRRAPRCSASSHRSSVGVVLTQLRHAWRADGSAIAALRPVSSSGGSRSAMRPSWASVAAMAPSAPTRLRGDHARGPAPPRVSATPADSTRSARTGRWNQIDESVVPLRWVRAIIEWPCTCKRRVDHVHVGDVGRDRACAAADRRAAAPSPATTAAGRTHRRRPVVVDADVDLVQRHRRRRARRDRSAAACRGRPACGCRVPCSGPAMRRGERHAGGGQQAAVLSGVHPARRRRCARRTRARTAYSTASPASPPRRNCRCMLVGGFAGVDGAARGGQALRHELAAERPLALRSAGRARCQVSSICPACTSSRSSSALMRRCPTSTSPSISARGQPQPVPQHGGGVVAERRRGDGRRVDAVDRHRQPGREVLADARLIELGEQRVGGHLRRR